MTKSRITEEDLNLLFLHARTANAFIDKDVPDDLLKEIYAAASLAPTAANSNPLRIVFVKTPAAKALLQPCLMEGNVDKTMSAPITALFAQDMKFYEHLPRLFPHADARSWYEGNEELIRDTAFRNATLQAGYFMLAARAFGLDCGPMSGFDADKINATFFPDGQHKVNFICNLGYADGSKIYPRSPRLHFDEACRIA